MGEIGKIKEKISIARWSRAEWPEANKGNMEK